MNLTTLGVNDPSPNTANLEVQMIQILGVSHLRWVMHPVAYKRGWVARAPVPRPMVRLHGACSFCQKRSLWRVSYQKMIKRICLEGDHFLMGKPDSVPYQKGSFVFICRVPLPMWLFWSKEAALGKPLLMNRPMAPCCETHHQTPTVNAVVNTIA